MINFSGDVKLPCENNAPKEPENVTKFREEVDKMTETYIRKNHDYGDSYARSVDELGVIGGVAPIYNKCNRLVQLAKSENPLVSNESLSDTLMDMASYCIMLKMAIDDNEQDSL